MGLGPPVCQHCQVMGSLNLETHVWYCKYCGETDLKDWAGLGDWTKYEQREAFLKQNQRFLNFMAGEDPDAPVSTKPK